LKSIFQRRFYAFFTPPALLSSPFLHAKTQTSPIVFSRRNFMDMVFVLGAALLWGLMVLLVWGFEKLAPPEGGRS
jgi:hypothetical protein